MAKITTITYQCDVCKKEFEDEKSIENTVIPCYGGAYGEYHESCSLDLCKKCAANVRKIIYERFAEINVYYGLSIKNKQEPVQ